MVRSLTPLLATLLLWGTLSSQYSLAAPHNEQALILYSSQDKAQSLLADSVAKHLNEGSSQPRATLLDVTQFKGAASSKKTAPLGSETVTRQKAALTAKSLISVTPYYHEGALVKAISAQGSATIIDLDDEAALSLARLRILGQFKDVRIAWLHSNFFQGNLSRVSNVLDETFVLGQDLRTNWVEAGAIPSKVKAYSLRLTPPAVSVARAQALGTLGFDANIDTVFVNSNTTPIKKLADYVHKLAVGFKTPVQIVVYCDASEDIAALKLQLNDIPAISKVFISNSLSGDMVKNLVTASDLYVSKATTEASNLGLTLSKPTLLVETEPGFQAENAAYLEHTHLAYENRIINLLTDEGLVLMKNAAQNQKRAEAQAAFNRGISVSRAVTLGTGAKASAGDLAVGDPNSKLNRMSLVALNRLENDSPADVELLLSYDDTDVGLLRDAPAQLSIRVADKIYPLTNSERLTSPRNLKDFIVSQRLPETVSVRIAGLTPQQLKQISVGLDQNLTRSQKIAPPALIALLEKNGLALGALPKAFSVRKLSRWLLSAKESLVQQPRFRIETVYYDRGTADTPSSRWNDLLLKPLRTLEIEAGKRIVVDTEQAHVSYENLNGLSASADRSMIATQQQEFSAIRQRLVEEQKQLEEGQKKILALKTDTLTIDVEAALKSFTDADMTLVKSGNEGSLSLAKQEILRDLRKRITTWEQTHADYEAQLDKFTFAQEDLYIRSSNFFMQTVANNLKLHFPEKKVAKLVATALEGAADFNQYDRNKAGYGTPHDRFRIDYMHYFFIHFRAFLTDLNGLQNTDSAMKRFVDGTVKSLPQFINGTIMAMPILPDLARLVLTVFTAHKSENSQKRFIKDFNAVIATFREAYGFKVDIIGAEQIPVPAPADEKTVTIFAPTHREGDHDLVTWSAMTSGNFGLDDYLLFGAADNFSPKPVADQLNKIDSFMLIGRGSDKPINKAIEQLKKTNVRAMMIFPEGGVDAGFFETRPVRKKFSTGLIRRLREEGYKINIVPLTYSRSGSFVYADPVSIPWSKDDESNRHLEIRVGKPIDTKTIDTLMSLGGDQTVNHYIRASWLENMSTDKDHINGQIRLDSFEERFAKNNKFNFPVGHACVDYMKELK